mmetsp:Transcript_5066/g.15926  ORF Transcript_5066/g.15926 Transcript_5066/m.15926 type:complete len:111 (+) Transcript_5066:252-584(+)
MIDVYGEVMAALCETVRREKKMRKTKKGARSVVDESAAAAATNRNEKEECHSQPRGVSEGGVGEAEVVVNGEGESASFGEEDGLEVRAAFAAGRQGRRGEEVATPDGSQG